MVGIKLGLPPTPSHEVARSNAPSLERVLAPKVPDLSVEVAESYTALGDDLLAGRVQVAWAPPIVCARVEMAGGRTLLRAVRAGATSYRAGIVARAGEQPDLSRAEDLAAAWVDEDSAAGYLLARSWLKARHIDAMHGFKSALFVGSYVSALQAVAERRADITSVYVSPLGTPPHSTLDEVEPALRAKLHILTVTGETQTDGIVVAPATRDDDVKVLVDALAALVGGDEGRDVMKQLFTCDELRAVPPRPTSNALRELIAFNERARAPR